MAKNSCGISIILPVFNCEKYIDKSINSILNQSYRNFELIIINDGSTDKSENIIKSFRDKRIRYYSQENQGLAKSINQGIKLARHEYIARQDADDISLPQRLEKQITYLQSNPNCNLLGTWAKIINEDKITNRYLIHPSTNSGCVYKLLFDCCFTHTSVMIRKSIFKEVGTFNENNDKVPPEDYEMWSRIAKKSNVANIPEVLVYFREHSSSMSYNKPLKLRYNAAKISIDNILYFSGQENYKIANSIATIYYGLDNILDEKINFLEIKNLLFSIIRKLEISKNDRNSFYMDTRKLILKLRIKWFLNYIFIYKYYKVFKPIFIKLNQNIFYNMILNKLKKIWYYNIFNN